MNIQNLNSEELKQLQSLLNKMNPQPAEKVYLDPVNQMIDESIDEFDFNRVQRAMDYLNWKWVGESVTVDMLKEEARRLLKGAAEARLGDYKNTHWEQDSKLAAKINYKVKQTTSGITFQLYMPNCAEYRDWETDRKSTRLNSSHSAKSRMPSSA